MPCMCWYEPKEEDKKKVKDLCQQLVDELKKQSNKGDPIYWGHDAGWEYASNLIKHLYTGHCNEKPKEI